MVATFGFNDIAGVRIGIALGATYATAGNFCGGCAGCLRVENGVDVTQGLVVLGHQAAEFFFKLHFPLQFRILAQGLDFLLQFHQGFFGLLKAVNLCRHGWSSQS